MWPVLFEIGSVPVYTYGVLHLLAVATMAVFGVAWFRRMGAGAATALDGAMAYPIAMFLLARIPYVFLTFGFTSEALRAFPRFTDGGFWGGLAILLLTLAAYARARRFPLWPTLDLFAPPVLLSLAVGKLGCLLGGCCWGGLSGAWPGLLPSSECVYGYPEGLLHPLPLYDSLWAFAGVVLLVLLARKRRPAGTLFLLFVLLYSFERFFSEFLRYRYTERTDLFGLFPSQVVELVAFFIAGALLAWIFFFRRTSATWTEAFPRIRDRVPPSAFRPAKPARRLLAFLLDALPAACLFAAGLVLGSWAGALLALLGSAAYLCVLVIPRRTPGMRLLGLGLVDIDGRPPGLARRLLRALVLPVPLVGIAGVFRPLASPSRQAFHDLVSGIFVVARDTSSPLNNPFVTRSSEIAPGEARVPR